MGVAIISVWLAACIRPALQMKRLDSIFLMKELAGELSSTNLMESDFVYRLPQIFDSRAFIQFFQSECASSGVEVEAISTWDASVSAEKLGRAGFSMDIDGSYSNIKSVLARTMGRTPNLVLRTLSIKRNGQPTEVQAHVEFIALNRLNTSTALPIRNSLTSRSFKFSNMMALSSILVSAN